LHASLPQRCASVAKDPSIIVSRYLLSFRSRVASEPRSRTENLLIKSHQETMFRRAAPCWWIHDLNLKLQYNTAQHATNVHILCTFGDHLLGDECPHRTSCGAQRRSRSGGWGRGRLKGGYY